MGLSRRQFTKEFKLAAIQRLERGASVAEGARGRTKNWDSGIQKLQHAGQINRHVLGRINLTRQGVGPLRLAGDH